MRSLIFLLLTGCGSPSSPSPKVAAKALPACPIELVAQHLKVAGVDLGEIIDEPEATTERLMIFQTGDEAWVSYPVPNAQHGPAGHDTIWKVSCSGKKLDTLTVAGADFGHAALHPDRKHLYFSSADAVVELDLATKTQLKITKPGTVPTCWGDEEKPTALRDSVTGATADYVELERGAPCGFEGEWEADAVRYHFATKREEIATPVTGAARAGDATLIAVERNCATEVLRSTDWKTWTPVASKKLIGPVTLIADGTTVLAVSVQCGIGSNGGAMVSRDGGKTWTEVANDAVMSARGSTLATLEVTMNGSDNWWKWNGKELVDTGKKAGDETSGNHEVPKTIGDRAVELTTFGLYDAKTKEKLYPR